MLGATAHSTETSAEAADADREHAPLAEEVAERAADQDQRAEREQVGVRDPLLPGEAAAQVLADGRQSDVDRGRVQARDERPHDRREQRELLAAARLPQRCHQVLHGQRSPLRRRSHEASLGSRSGSRSFSFRRGGVVPPRSERLCMNCHDPSPVLPDTRPLQQLRHRARSELDTRAIERRRVLGLPPLLHGQRVPRVAGRPDRPLRGAQAPGTGLGNRPAVAPLTRAAATAGCASSRARPG